MIAAIWGRFSTWIIAALGVLAAVAGVYFKGRSAGKEVEREKVIKRDIAEAKAHAETIHEVTDVQSNVVRLPDSDVRQRLRDKWTRKD
jgi:F0F1-type ATP synthase membrane subunit b/b'